MVKCGPRNFDTNLIGQRLWNWVLPRLKDFNASMNRNGNSSHSSSIGGEGVGATNSNGSGNSGFTTRIEAFAGFMYLFV
jgi:hypothetical protein